MVYVKTEYYVTPEGFFQSDKEATQWTTGNSGISFGPFSTYEAAEQALAALMRSGRFLGAQIEKRINES